MSPSREDGGEFALIARFFAPLARHPAALGLTDDAALLDVPPGRQLVVTADALVAGVHFFADDPADLVARKMVRVNLSDLAAMGADPLAGAMTIAVPPDLDAAWFEAFASGLKKDIEEFDFALIGGDTVATPGPLTLSLTALGTVVPGAALRRSGAHPDEAIFVSGTIGDGALGLLARRQGRGSALVERYLLPSPRLALGRSLRGIATAALDISDGLVADLGHLCDQSGVGAVIETHRIPLSVPAREAVEKDPALWEVILTGGDDYELLFTAPPAREAEVAALGGTRIGTTVPSGGVRVLDANGQAVRLQKTGFTHF